MAGRALSTYTECFIQVWSGCSALLSSEEQFTSVERNRMVRLVVSVQHKAESVLRSHSAFRACALTLE